MKGKTQRPKRLVFRDSSGAGKQIHAEIDFSPNCAEFVLKKGLQMIASEPWIQFKPKDWSDMVSNTFQEMVDAWNEKYCVEPFPKEGASDER